MTDTNNNKTKINKAVPYLMLLNENCTQEIIQEIKNACDIVKMTELKLGDKQMWGMFCLLTRIDAITLWSEKRYLVFKFESVTVAEKLFTSLKLSHYSYFNSAFRWTSNDRATVKKLFTLEKELKNITTLTKGIFKAVPSVVANMKKIHNVDSQFTTCDELNSILVKSQQDNVVITEKIKAFCDKVRVR
jgi:hypothetical protein